MGVALPLAGSVDIVMHVIVWHVGGRIDVFFCPFNVAAETTQSHTEGIVSASPFFSKR